jgi:hypothetical protein
MRDIAIAEPAPRLRTEFLKAREAVPLHCVGRCEGCNLLRSPDARGLQLVRLAQAPGLRAAFGWREAESQY